METKIITTIGPSSLDDDTLSFFSRHSVEIARLNFSHGTAQWHLDAAKKCRTHGLKIMLDLAGPKILLGSIPETFEISRNRRIALEYNVENKDYPRPVTYNGESIMKFPCQFAIETFVEVGMSIYIDDGKIKLQVESVTPEMVVCMVINGGVLKSNKGVNIPEAQPNIDFLVTRDRVMLQELLAEVQPDYIAASYVRNAEDIQELKKFCLELYEEAGVEHGPIQICTKLELQKAVQPDVLHNIIEQSSMLMVARGDLALESEPIHISVPFYQTEIVQLAKQHGIPCVVATQMLETMTTSQVPTRAEVSDVYRAVVLEPTHYIMLSGETAAGEFPKEAVTIMHDIIVQKDSLSQKIKREYMKYTTAHTI